MGFVIFGFGIVSLTSAMLLQDELPARLATLLVVGLGSLFGGGYALSLKDHQIEAWYRKE